MSDAGDTLRRERDGFRVEAAPGPSVALDVLLDAVLPDPWGAAVRGTVLRATLHRTTSRVPLADGRGVILKVHRSRGLREALLARVGRGRARAEWRAARFLGAAGLPVPAPLAVGESRRRGPGSVSFFAATFLEGATPLDRARAGREGLDPEVGRLVRRLHDVGFDHRDLHPGNVLVGPDGRPWLVDLHRSAFPRRVGRRAREDALARLALDLPGALPALLEAYGPGPRPDAVTVRIARLAAERRRSRSRRALREGTVFTRDVGPGRGARRRDLPLERIEKALDAHDAALRAGDGRVAKRNRRGVVTCHGDLVVKEHAPSGLLARLRARLFPLPLAAGYRNAHALSVRGFDAARPLAFLLRRRRAFTLLEDLSACPRLDLLAREVFARPDRERRASLRDATADWVARLHATGTYHGDLKGVNIRVRGDPAAPGGWRFPLIDTDRCRFLDRPLDDRRRVKNLAQLAASIPRSVTRTERLRWFRRYARASGWRATERVVATAVARALARKVVVVDEPIE